MSKTIAGVALIAIQCGLTLGNYYFTFGLWPRSWGSFALFIILNAVNLTLIQAWKNEK